MHFGMESYCILQTVFFRRRLANSARQEPDAEGPPMRPEASLTLTAADVAAYELTGLVKEGRLDRLPLFGHACCRLAAAGCR